MAGKVAFVLGSFDHAPLIVNRLDYKVNIDGSACGVGITLLEEGAHERGDVETVFDLIEARRRDRGDGVVVLDIGANVGTHTVAWARSMEEWGGVIAIEAQERIFYALCGNIALNNCFNARAIWAVAGRRSGAVATPVLDHRSPANFGGLSLLPTIKQDPGQLVDFSPPAMVGVPALRIDDLNLRRCDLIKVDVEGMEGEVLDGARSTIDRCRPLVYAEVSTCGADAITSRLSGYRMQPGGMNILAMPEEDPIWGRLRVVGE